MNRRALWKLFAVMLAWVARGSLAGEEQIVLRSGAGHDITATRCVICHSLDYIEMNAPVMDRTAWQKTIRKMIDRFGAPVSADEAREILDYLSTQYSRSSR
jgi:mono/diheme cytochrome c family protein